MILRVTIQSNMAEISLEYLKNKLMTLYFFKDVFWWTNMRERERYGLF